MNNFPFWWDSVITLFNRVENDSTHQVTWYKTVLENCFWKYDNTTVYQDNGRVDTNTTICRIPVNPKYVDKSAFDAMTAADRAKHFTVGYGDIVVLGKVADTVDEYTAGSRSSDLLNKYKKQFGCMTVKQFSVNRRSGIMTEHYLLRGV